MNRPKLLDLFCGAGGAGEGYRRAGFDITGVDIRPQPRYCAGDFIQSDAIAYALAYGWQYDAIHASPPCQIHSGMGRIHGEAYTDRHVDLIPQTRFALASLGVPYIIENVAGARRALRNPLMLCGAQFELKVYRHRYFESNVLLFALPHTPHHDNTPPAGQGRSDRGFISITGGGIRGVSQQERFAAMGIDWMTNAELTEAIPPAYTEYLGKQLIQCVNKARNHAGF